MLVVSGECEEFQVDFRGGDLSRSLFTKITMTKTIVCTYSIQQKYYKYLQHNLNYMGRGFPGIRGVSVLKAYPK